MAEITPLRFKKDASWEGENELEEYYTDADKRADLLKFLGTPDGNGGYTFDRAKWESQQEEYKKLSTEYGDARKSYDDWVKEQDKKGLELKDYENNPEFQQLDNAQKEAQAKLDKIFSGDMQALLMTDAPEVALNFLQVYGEVEKNLKDHPELKEKFLALKEFTGRMIENGWNPEGGKNKLQLQYRDGQLLLRVDDLGGRGLHFAIKDDLSIVFTEDKTLKRSQVEELARVFDKVGMEVDNFAPTDKLKVVDDNDESKEVGSFENVFKSYSRAAWKDMELEELRRIQKENEDNGISNPALDDVIAQKTAEEEYAGQDYDADGQTGQTSEIGGADAPSYEGNPFAEYLQEKDKNISLRKMKEKILARAGIMRINRRSITTRRMPDGSMVISFYGSEQDKMNDGKLKDGIAQHTKKCAFRMWNTRPPRIGIYVPQGAKFETAYAKGALGALKGCGYNYFEMPSAAEFGGDAQKAFWEAAGDQLMCPLLKSKDNPNGCDIGNDHLQVILKAIKDKGADDEQDVLLFKMRLIGQLQAYKEYKESKGEKLSDKIGDTISMLEGDVRLSMYTTSTFPALKAFIEKGINGELKDAQGNPVKWDRVDAACAYEALGRITQGVVDGKIQYDYLHGNNSEQMIQLLGSEMNKCRGEVLKEFNNRFKTEGEDINVEPENRTQSRLTSSSGAALAFYYGKMNSIFAEIEKTGSEFAKKLKLDKKDREIVLPSYDKQTKKIINRPIPGIAQANTPTPTRGGYTGR